MGGMSVRNELVDFTTDIYDMYLEGGTAYVAERIDGYLSAFAHELAEKQRAAIKDFDLDDHEAVYYRATDVQSLPDLIDPQAEKTEG